MKLVKILLISCCFLLYFPPVSFAQNDCIQTNYILNEFLLEANLLPPLDKVAPTVDEHIQKKVVYLTFDDGPNVYTAELLQILRAFDIHATFFLLGNNTKKFPQITREIVRNGHSIGLHSMTHDYKKLYSHGPVPLLEELNENFITIENITGLKTKLVRVPYGSKPYMTKEFRKALIQEKYKMWDWTIDSQDWMLKDKPFDIFKHTVEQLQYDREIILFHDSKQTIAVLPLLISYLKSSGYTFQSYDQNHHFSHNFWLDDKL